MANEPKGPTGPTGSSGAAGTPVSAVGPAGTPTPGPTATAVGQQNLAKAGEATQSVAKDAPAVSTDTPIRKRRRALEAELKNLQENKSRANQKARAVTATMLAELKDIEARQHGGLNELTPVGNLLALDAAMHEQYPDDHLRWINETIPGRAALLKSLGYERVPDQVAGGDTVLWKIPRNKYAERAVTKQVQTDRNLAKATGQSRDEVVHELQTFFDKHGINVDANKYIINAER